ncbi:alanyl-tRNA synthetase [Klebsiella pneumoniae subsp. ozaenae]|uniref:Alanyl-tRNA synthetase n=1 Tax=Klebsiella pneumoniae subsp. ozaenae TaxID=574 RepID=A0A377Z628_KLEPO|nr:alanyl-tRNA synthetase [Klebsiella pneumoniae subsp. ozaenae]
MPRAHPAPMALFGEKYDDRVRVLRMGDFSTELCGGLTRRVPAISACSASRQESGTAAGVRRIEAVTGGRRDGHPACAERSAQ